MKKVVILILFLFCINDYSFAQDDASCVFHLSGRTTCHTDEVALSSAQSNVNTTFIEYMYGVQGQAFYIYFTFGSSELQYLNTDRVYFLLDGKRENYELISSDNNVSSSNVMEQYYIRMALEDVERFINAEEISFKIRNDTYQFNDQAKDRMNQLKEKISEMESQE